MFPWDICPPVESCKMLNYNILGAFSWLRRQNSIELTPRLGVFKLCAKPTEPSNQIKLFNLQRLWALTKACKFLILLDRSLTYSELFTRLGLSSSSLSPLQLYSRQLDEDASASRRLKTSECKLCTFNNSSVIDSTHLSFSEFSPQQQRLKTDW